MKLNKLMLTTVLAASSITAVQAASTASVNFVGSVTSATCDTSIEVGGVPTPSNIVDLGSTAPSTSGTAVAFEIVSKASGGGACTATGTADVFWSSGNMTSSGFDNATGTATGAYMTLTGKPTGGNVSITSTTTNVQYTNAEVLAGMEFEAQLVASTTAGTFNTTGTYHVIYN